MKVLDVNGIYYCYRQSLLSFKVVSCSTVKKPVLVSVPAPLVWMENEGRREKEKSRDVIIALLAVD